MILAGVRNRQCLDPLRLEDIAGRFEQHEVFSTLVWAGRDMVAQARDLNRSDVSLSHGLFLQADCDRNDRNRGQSQDFFRDAFASPQEPAGDQWASRNSTSRS